MKSKIRDAAGELFRYLVAGGVAFAADFGVLYVLTEWCGLHYMLSQAVGYSVGLVITYLLSMRWVYLHRRYRNVPKEFLLFALVGFVGIASTSLLMWLLTDKAELDYLVSKTLTTLAVTLQNFYLRKRLLFSRPHPLRSESAADYDREPADDLPF